MHYEDWAEGVRSNAKMAAELQEAVYRTWWVNSHQYIELTASLDLRSAGEPAELLRLIPRDQSGAVCSSEAFMYEDVMWKLWDLSDMLRAWTRCKIPALPPSNERPGGGP